EEAAQRPRREEDAGQEDRPHREHETEPGYGSADHRSGEGLGQVVQVIEQPDEGLHGDHDRHQDHEPCNELAAEDGGNVRTRGHGLKGLYAGGRRLTMRTCEPPRGGKEYDTSSMNERMKKMPRPSALSRFSGARGSPTPVGSKPVPSSWISTSRASGVRFITTSTRFDSSILLPCLIAFTTDSRTATLM